MNGQGGMNLSGMSSLVSNPSMQNLIKNPDFLSNALNMMKDPKNKGMTDMLQKQYPGMNVNALIRVLEFLINLASGYRKVKSVFANKFF